MAVHELQEGRAAPPALTERSSAGGLLVDLRHGDPAVRVQKGSATATKLATAAALTAGQVEALHEAGVS